MLRLSLPQGIRNEYARGVPNYEPARPSRAIQNPRKGTQFGRLSPRGAPRQSRLRVILLTGKSVPLDAVGCWNLRRDFGPSKHEAECSVGQPTS